MSKVKETALRILSLLPGVDCGGFGGCGYPTCEACAQAIAEGKSARRYAPPVIQMLFAAFQKNWAENRLAR